MSEIFNYKTKIDPSRVHMKGKKRERGREGTNPSRNDHDYPSLFTKFDCPGSANAATDTSPTCATEDNLQLGFFSVYKDCFTKVVL